MSALAGAAVAAKRAARQKPTPSAKEDPRHTWNQQLTEACLACDLPRVRELVKLGADPVNAREVPPPAFYIGPFAKALQEEQQQQQVTKLSAEDGPTVAIDAGSDIHNHDAAAGSTDTATAGGRGGGDGAAVGGGAAATNPAPVDRLSPLVMMLLSGLNTLAARRVIAYLVNCGAGVNDTFGFAGEKESVVEGDAVAGAGEDAAAAPQLSTAEAKKGQRKKHPVAASRSNSLGQTAGGPMASAGGAFGEEAHAQKSQGECMVEGSVLHYVVNRGDHAQLLRLLLLAAEQPKTSPPSLYPAGRDASASAGSGGMEDDAAAAAVAAALPYSLLSAVEQETVVGALRYQQMPSLQHPHTGRPLSGSKASGGANADESGALSGTMRGKVKSAQTPALSGAGSPSLTRISPQSPSAPFVASAASADGVVAALKQRLQEQYGTVGAAQRHLPVLTCAYPYVCDETAAAPLPSTTAAAAAASGGEGQSGESVLRQALAAMWTLRQICDATPRTTPSPITHATEAVTNATTATATPMQPLSTRVLLDLSCTDSQGRTAAATALQRGDTLSFRLLIFFGAATPVTGLVNATQTRLARACARGDVTRVEALLRQGDPLAQISADGRYTLIHYAAAHLPVLKVLVERGLSLEHENVWGETAVLSLQRHGTARNEGRYVHTLFATAAQAAATSAAAAGVDAVPATANSGSVASAAAAPQPAAAPPVSLAVSNAVAFAHMSPATQRNYILCPPLQLPSLTGPTNERGGGGGGGGGASSRSATLREGSASASARRVCPSQSTDTPLYQSGPAAIAAAAVAGVAMGAVDGSGDAITGAAASAESAFLGGREAGTWWAFLPPTTTTADAIDTLLQAGAVLQGYIPDDELDLPYVRFAETQAAASALAGGNGDGLHYSEECGEAEEAEESYTSHVSLSGSACTLTPATYPSSSRMKRSMMGGPCADSLPGRLPLRVTPLQQAIVDYHPELIRRLVIDYRVDPMQRDSQGATALHYAALCTHAPSVLELLLSPQVMVMHVKVGSAGAPSIPGIGVGGGGASAAAAAAATAASSGGSGAEAPISIPAAVASKIDLNGVDMAGRTPLFYAALVGNEEAVRLLLRFGALAQVGRGDRDGWTPLHIAVTRQHPTVVELLICHTKQLLETAAGAGGAGAFPELLAASGGSAGARRSSTRGGGAVSGGGSTRRSSRRSASLNNANRTRRSGSNPTGATAAAGAGGGGTYATDLLFANGAVALVDVEAEDKETHMTALEMLIKQMQPRVPASAAQMRMAVALLSEGQASSLRPSGLAHGGTLLHRVVVDGQVELTELLLSYYADPDEVDDADETPLFLAVRQAPAVAATAAETTDSSGGIGSSPDDQEQRQRQRRTSLVRVLLQYGATPFAQSALSLETPQHLAARSLAASATDDVEELIQLLFYTAPDRKATAAGGNGASRHRRSGNRSRSREHGVLSRVLETMEAESAQQCRGSKRSGRLSGGGSAREGALRLRLNRSNSEGGRVDRRHGSMDSNGSPGRDRRGVPQQSPKRSGGVGSGQPPFKPPGSAAAEHGTSWRGAGGGVDPFDGLSSPADPPGDDQSSFVNSSFASVGATNFSGLGDDDERNNNNDRSTATSRPDSPEASVLTTLSQRGDTGVIKGGAEVDAEFRRAVLRQWQSPEHLLSATHCWLLTNARGQTPLHVLCSSACPAVQAFPPLLKLLKDLQTLTVQRDPSLPVVAATTPMGGGGGEREVLSTLWSLPDAQGRTPLHAAAQSGFAEAVEIILHLSPASVAAVDVHGWTPLHACVLMATDNTTTKTAFPSSRPPASSTPADVFHTYNSRSVAESPQLQRIIAALRDALTRLSHRGAAVPLMGQPIHRMGRDILPTPLCTTTATSAHATDEVTRESSAAASRLVAALVQPSTITAQLQRWQRTRHWGAPTLLNGSGMSGGETREPLQQQQHRTNALLLKGSSDGVSGWRAYMQLPDGQGRTALLLAAEVGNRSAARELLLQAR